MLQSIELSTEGQRSNQTLDWSLNFAQTKSVRMPPLSEDFPNLTKTEIVPILRRQQLDIFVAIQIASATNWSRMLRV